VRRYSNTEYERIALHNRINLSDGHARQPLTRQQRAIVAQSGALFELALTRQQNELEDEFIGAFFRCAGQTVAHGDGGVYLTYSSSCAMKYAAQYCRLRALRVRLLEPCFDSIRHLVQTEGIPHAPITEGQLLDIKHLPGLLDSSSALWLVQPNNPTGFCLERAAFEAVVAVAVEVGATLVVDFCFRFYADGLGAWDQYRMLVDSGVSFICIEDTGKTWPLADMKVGIVVCSAATDECVRRLQDQLLLNVSPLHLLLLTAFIENSIEHGITSTVRWAIEENRHLVHALVAEGRLSHGAEWCSNVPMELLGLPGGLSAKELWSVLRDHGVEILPAHNYFWSRQEVGEQWFRIALSRPTPMFAEGVARIKAGIELVGGSLR
jgi:aspartate/methionine/tyrosine aminotransferase